MTLYLLCRLSSVKIYFSLFVKLSRFEQSHSKRHLSTFFVFSCCPFIYPFIVPEHLVPSMTAYLGASTRY